MIYVLINKLDEIVDTVELDGNVGKTGRHDLFSRREEMKTEMIFINYGR